MFMQKKRRTTTSTVPGTIRNSILAARDVKVRQRDHAVFRASRVHGEDPGHVFVDARARIKGD